MAWDGVNIIAQQLLRDGKPLPPELASWVADVLEDVLKAEKKRPRGTTSRGQDPHATLLRDNVIIHTVECLLLRGFNATRSTKKTGNGPAGKASAAAGSACDAVGEAFGMNYKAVERVWATDRAFKKVLRRYSCRRPGILHKAENE